MHARARSVALRYALHPERMALIHTPCPQPHGARVNFQSLALLDPPRRATAVLDLICNTRHALARSRTQSWTSFPRPSCAWKDCISFHHSTVTLCRRLCTTTLIQCGTTNIWMLSCHGSPPVPPLRRRGIRFVSAPPQLGQVSTDHTKGCLVKCFRYGTYGVSEADLSRPCMSF